MGGRLNCITERAVVSNLPRYTQQGRHDRSLGRRCVALPSHVDENATRLGARVPPRSPGEFVLAWS
ncbi:MAG TPA: hypothetical protein VGO81_15145, partial [Solirubrobacteraceae bacterium]|nr:hypothetical protein [Solirubrobacteraceae bacterium]